MIELSDLLPAAQNGSSKEDNDSRLVERYVHPDWEHWMAESCYSREEARQELGWANGTFYRRIAKAPTLVDRLAMAALFEGLPEWTAQTADMIPERRRKKRA